MHYHAWLSKAIRATSTSVFIALSAAFLLISTSQKSYSQNPRAINYSVREGLPSSEVYEIFCDRDGFLWFATDNGVARFDGKDFQKYNVKDSLSDPIVFGFYEDLNGKIWFRTFTGKLSYYANGKITRYPFNGLTAQLANRAIITQIQLDSLNNLWLSLDKNFIQIDSNGNMIQTVAIASRELRYFQTKNFNLLSTHGMLKRITKIKIFDKDFPIQVSDTTQWLQSSYSLEVDNKIYIALNSDLFEYSNNKLVKVFTGPAPITSLSLVKKDDLWLGFLNKGATKISLKNYLVNPATPDLNGKTITRVLLDKEGGYWFSTIEKGVYYIPNFEIKTHPFRTQSRVKSAAVIGRTITIGDYSGRLINEDIYTGVAKWERNFESAIISVFAAQDSTIWVSTINGTYLITQQGLVKRKLYESSFINFAQSDSLGIWGFNSHGFHYFNKDGQLQRKKRLKEWYRNISVDPPDIYLGGRNGLFVYDTIFQFKNELSTFKNSKLSKVITLNDSLIAVATIGSGFYLWNKMTSQVNYSSLTNFKSESIYDLIKVDSSLWVATEHGVAIFNLNELQKGKSEYDFITNQYGLIGNRVIQLLNSKTAILALSDEGYSAIPIQHTKFINKKPRVYLKNFKVNGLSVSAHFPLKLKNHQNNIQFEIGYLSFNNQNFRSRFRLTNRDKWTISDSRLFQFNSLSAGNYVFELEVSADNNTWQKSSLRIVFSIDPPWWDTTIFRVSLMLIVLLASLTIYRRSMARYQEKNKYLSMINDQQRKLLNAEIEATERERSRIAKDIHDGIGTDLASIKLTTSRIAKKINPEDATEIEEQVERTIEEIRNIIYGLNPPGLTLFGLGTTLQNYLSVVEKNHLIKTSYNFQGTLNDKKISAVLFRIIQELITNSIKHSKCTKIELHINVFNDAISIVYLDNGIGFNQNEIIEGLGLSSITSRVALLNGELSSESGSFGTSYSIDVPLTKE